MTAVKKLGRVLHLSPSRKLIIRTERLLPIGTEVFNNKMEVIGTVYDVFGPISKPYISIRPRMEKPERYVGKFIYVRRGRRGGIG